MKRKIYSLILTIALAIGLVPYAVCAEGDSVVIKTPSKISAGTTFTLKITPADGEFEYQWLTSDTEDGEYTEILSDTSASYIVTPRDKGKYIKARVINTETEEVTLSSNSIFIENLGPVSRTGFNTDNINATMLTPAENKFTVDGKEFILLDEFDDESSRYYVMTEDRYGAKPFDASGYAKFDPQADGNIGKFLNNEFLTEGGAGKVLPAAIQEHINFEHVWWTEAGLSNGDCPTDYSFVAGLSFLSQSEAIKYRNKYGWQPGGSSVVDPWWGRTQRGVGGGADNILVMMNSNDGGKGNMWDKSCTISFFLRPTFYLDGDFFKDVRLNISKTGENVKKMIVEKYTLDELEAIYSLEDLIALGFDIKSTVISKNGEVLTASTNDDEAVDFKYKWYISDSEEEQGTEVYSNTTDTYIISTNDESKYVGVAVTPIYADGSEGEPVKALNKIYVDGFGAMGRTDYGAEDRRSKKDNPKEYLFTAGGEEMILLDAYSDDLDTLYVMTANTKGAHPFDSDNTQKFDPEDLNNIGFWLNNDFLTASQTISEDVQPYINKNHIWWTEGGQKDGLCPEDYSFTAGVALLSRTEYSKYWGKFGWDHNDSVKTAWWLRTGRNSGAADIFCAVGIQDGNYSIPNANGYGNTWNKAANASYYVRPTFYLNKDFLLNVKITDMGEKAAEAIRKVLTTEEFLECDAGYSENELLKLGLIERPKANNVNIMGRASVGAELKGSYLYFAEKPENGSTYGFETSDDGEKYVKASDGDVLKLTKAYDKKYIRFFVTPINVDGVIGETYYSKAVKVSGTVTVAAEGVEVTDSNGNAVYSLKNADKLKVKANLVNYTDSDKDVWVMIYIYDKDGKMLDNRGVKVKVGANARVVNDKLSISLPEYTDGNYAKLIIWDGLLSMNPAQNTALIIQ